MFINSHCKCLAPVSFLLTLTVFTSLCSMSLTHTLCLDLDLCFLTVMFDHVPCLLTLTVCLNYVLCLLTLTVCLYSVLCLLTLTVCLYSFLFLLTLTVC